MGFTKYSSTITIAIIAIILRSTWNNGLIVEYLDEFIDYLQQGIIQTHLHAHIYLNNNYAPVDVEHSIPEPAILVKGSLPADLDGVFIRNGPNPIPAFQRKFYHWFDGHGHLHNLRIKDGSALYSNAYVPTPRYTIEKHQKGKQYFNGIGELKGIPGLLKAILIGPQKALSNNLTAFTTGQANTHTIMTTNSKFYACHEASLPFELQLDRNGSIVQGLGYETFDHVLDYPVSAHPKNDVHTGELLFHSYTLDPALVEKYGSLKVGVYNVEENEVDPYIGIRTTTTTTTTSSSSSSSSDKDNHVSFAHDFIFTENYIILYDSSAHFDTMQIMNMTNGSEGGGDFITWNHDHKMKIGLLPRRKKAKKKDGNMEEVTTSNEVIWFELEKPYMMIHPLNAWEDKNGNVILWTPISESFRFQLDDGSNQFHMTEFILNVRHGTIERNDIDESQNVEFSRVQDDKVGRFTRFGIASILDPTLGGDGISKGYAVYDMELRKLHMSVLYEEGDIGGEAIMIPKDDEVDSTVDDVGDVIESSSSFYVGTYVYNSIDKGSYFVLYSDGEMIARLKLPYRVPFGFHALWVTGDQLEKHVELHEKAKI